MLEPSWLGYLAKMVTVHLAQGLRFVIFLNDHEPAHLHVFGEGHAKIDIAGADGPTLVWAQGMKRNDIRRAMAIAVEEQGRFLARWNEIHG